MTAESKDQSRHELETTGFRALLDAAVDAIITIDRSGNVLEFNAAAQRLFSYTTADVSGKNVHILMPEPDRSQHDAYLKRYLSTGEKRIIGVGREVNGKRADGSTFPMHLSVGDAGDFFVGIIRDLSAEKFAEEESRQLQDRLSEVDRYSLMGEMAAGLAHEINQPLSAITTYSQAGERLMAQNPPDMESLEEICRKISDQAIRAGQIIQSLRSFVSKQEAREDRLDINEVVANVLGLIEADTRSEGIALTTDYADDLPTIIGDSIQLQQVLMNLTRNATDAMSDGLRKEDGIVIQTGTKQNGQVVLVSVTDHGPKKEGLGVGLAVSHTIVQAHGGELRYKPNRDGGAIFEILLPAGE
jgi:two-component system sensor kinase FixL